MVIRYTENLCPQLKYGVLFARFFAHVTSFEPDVMCSNFEQMSSKKNIAAGAYRTP